MRINDGFCDFCNKFAGHEDLRCAKTPAGEVMACQDCQIEISELTPAEQKKRVLEVLSPHQKGSEESR